LISDILDLSKVEAGKEELILSQVDIADLCTYCLSLVQEKAIAAGLKLSQSIDPQIDVWIADERRLRQMMLNLLSNAIKFTPSGEVSLLVEKQSEGISMTVIDSGIGIAPDQLPNLFQPFHQLDSQLNRRYEGTGLGLVLTQRLAWLHGGDVTVESVLGQGSRFTISLPDLSKQPMVSGDTAQFLALSTVAEPSQSNLAQAGLKGFSATIRQKRIAIVDGDQSNVVLLQNYLKVAGYQVQYLRSGNDFLERLRSFQPNLILMDTQLASQGTGIELLIDLRRQTNLQYLPVVVMAATAIQGDRDRYLAAGATDYLNKPIGLTQIESLLLRFL